MFFDFYVLSWVWVILHQQQEHQEHQHDHQQTAGAVHEDAALAARQREQEDLPDNAENDQLNGNKPPGIKIF